MGILDLVNGYDDINEFLAKQKNLGDDLLALQRAITAWKSDVPIDVGESGTLYRLLKFASWKLNANKKFITKGTLTERNITDDKKITTLSQKELLMLDNRTSQWATAAALLGDEERIENPPFKLKITYDAIDHWQEKRREGKCWEPRYDETISRQASAFVDLLAGKKISFVPKQAEDFCFAYVFGFITAEEGEKKWPALRGHESDRITEIQEMMKYAKDGKEITSKDHRVVQAIAMWGKVNDKNIQILYPSAVNKTWPQFFDFIVSCSKK